MTYDERIWVFQIPVQKGPDIGLSGVESFAKICEEQSAHSRLPYGIFYGSGNGTVQYMKIRYCTYWYRSLKMFSSLHDFIISKLRYGTYHLIFSNYIVHSTLPRTNINSNTVRVPVPYGYLLVLRIPFKKNPSPVPVPYHTVQFISTVSTQHFVVSQNIINRKF